MPADQQCAPTEIVLYVRRESRTNEKPADGPPPPLAEPLIDLNIQPGQARGYEVRAGQLIQIVDVKGRECTDFQAFSLRGLDRGIEREIDPTTTRTLMGALYPDPGCTRSTTPWTRSRCWSSSRTRAVATTRSASPAPHGTTRTWGIPDT